MPTVSIKTIGCRLNQAESAQMAGRLQQAGFTVVPFGETADAVIIHTCTITANAERTCTKLAGVIKRDHPETIVALAGCAVEVDRETLQQRTHADLLLDQEEKDDVALLLAARLKDDGLWTKDHGLQGADRKHVNAEQQALPLPHSTFRVQHPTSPHPPSTINPQPSTPVFGSTRALVKVQDGCDFGCAYCIVPAARGIPISRPLQEVTDEITALVERGYREVVLTGANLGRYDHQGDRLPQLIRAILNTTGLERLRLGSIETTTVESEILELMASSDVICRFLHLPLQSGDDTVLRAMGRRYTAGEYRAFVERAAAELPGVGLGADIITGFPGETDQAFANTRNLVESLPFSNLHVFPYSERKGTQAVDLPNSVPVDLRRERARELIAIGDRKRQQFAQQCVGQDLRVLIEHVDSEGTASGWTSEYLDARIRRPAATPNDIIAFVPKQAINGTLHD